MLHVLENIKKESSLSTVNIPQCQLYCYSLANALESLEQQINSTLLRLVLEVGLILFLLQILSSGWVVVETSVNTLMISYYLLTVSDYITVYTDRLFIYSSCDSAYIYENEVFSYLFLRVDIVCVPRFMPFLSSFSGNLENVVYVCEWIAYVPCLILVVVLQTIWSPSSLCAMCHTLKQMAQWGYWCSVQESGLAYRLKVWTNSRQSYLLL